MVAQSEKSAAAAADTISIDPAVIYTSSVFIISGSATSALGVSKVEIYASIDGSPSQLLGEANVNPDGSFKFDDVIGAHKQTSISATVYGSLGGTVSAPASYQLRQITQQQRELGEQIRYSPDDTNQTSPTADILFYPSGQQQVSVIAPNQTFYSTYFDTFLNGGVSSTTFVFTKNYGVDTIKEFLVATDDRDFISLPGEDFGFSNSNVLANTSDIKSGVQIKDPMTGDEIFLNGITKQQLTQNQASIILRPLCFGSLTGIRTLRGDICVEDLIAGDLVVTLSGAHRPIRWLGRRTLDCCGDLAATRPIRISAGAFGAGLPGRNLMLSPGHPVLVHADEDGSGGHLVPIMCLINGTTIERVAVDEVTYWHVELDQHDILLAEGLPCESYIDLGSRPWFAGVDGALYDPDMALPGMPGRCRPVAIDGPIVEAERRRLDENFATRLAAAAAWPVAEDALAL